MLFRRLIFGMLMRVAQNPAVQKKAGEVALKALKQARPSLRRASTGAGELARAAKRRLLDEKSRLKKSK